MRAAVDMLIAGTIIIFIIPFMAISALAIKWDSFGPVLYKQERVGFNGRRFILLKFRSMVADAEPDGRPVWAAERDARITRVGRFIRRARIDELPQLFNVLCGDMSMVGPRPERPFFVEQLTKVIPFYAERHKVKPGITGWAQINYPYGASIEDARRKLSYDLFYIKNCSFVFDLIILISTVRVALSKWGAR